MRDRVEARLAAVFQDVPVPDALAERLLARLADAGGNESPINESPIVAAAPCRLNRKWGARRVLRVAGVLSAAAAIAFAVWLRGGSPTNPTEQAVLDEAIRCFQANDDAGTSGSKTISPAGYPSSQWLVRLAGSRCRSTGGFLGRPGVAYDLPGLGPVHAVLYVVRPSRPLEGFRTSPAPRPFTTAGCCASAWQENGLLYTLVVKGEPASYEAYLNLAVEPVA